MVGHARDGDSPGELRVPIDLVTWVFARIRAGAELGYAKGLGDLMERDLGVLAPFCRGMSYGRITETRAVKPVDIRNV